MEKGKGVILQKMSENINIINEIILPIGRLGKLPAKSSPKSLLLTDFAQPDVPPNPPASTSFWKKKAKFPLRTFGNTQFGDCTRAKQAIAAMRMERIETGRTPQITDDEVIRVYEEMENRLYGGGDNGAFEEDALSEWRKPDLTFRDSKGNPLTIEAFLKIQQADLTAVKNSIVAAKSHGIAICMNLPKAFATQKAKWDIPEGQSLTGDYLPQSWGGHSMFVDEYNEFGLRHPTTWGIPDIWISWKAFLAYCDESHLFIDSIDAWRKKGADKFINLDAVKDAVNQVSSQKIR